MMENYNKINVFDIGEELKEVEKYSGMAKHTSREDLRIDLEASQIPVTLNCDNYSFLIEPGNSGAEVWRFHIEER